MKIDNSQERKLNENLKDAKLDQCKAIPKILEKLNKDISEIDSKIKDGKKVAQNQGSQGNSKSAAEECLDLKNLVKQSVDGLNDIFNVKISKNVGLNVHSSCRNLASSKGFEIIEEELDIDKNQNGNNNNTHTNPSQEESAKVKKNVIGKFKGKLNSSNTKDINNVSATNNNNTSSALSNQIEKKKQNVLNKNNDLLNNSSNTSQVNSNYSNNNLSSLNVLQLNTPETKNENTTGNYNNSYINNNLNNEIISSNNTSTSTSNPLKNSYNKKFKGLKNPPIISDAKVTPTSKKSTANKIGNLNNFKLRKLQNPTIEIKTQVTPHNKQESNTTNTTINSSNNANSKRNDRYTNINNNNSNVSQDNIRVSDHKNNKSPNPKNYQLKPRRELKTSDQNNTSNRQNSGAYSSYKTEAETANSLSKNSSKKQIGNIKILHQGSQSVSKNKNYCRSKTDVKNGNLFHYNKFSRNRQEEEFNVISLMNIIFLFNESNNAQINDDSYKKISQSIGNFTREVIREEKVAQEMISTQNIIDNQGFEEKEVQAIKKIQRQWRNFKVFQNLKVKEEESKIREIKNHLLHSLHTNETFQIINSHLKTCLKLFKSLGANKSIF
jgi:hypothetical protein